MIPDGISLREIITRRRYEERWGDPRRFSTLWNLISVGFSWSGTPEGRRFWFELYLYIRRKFPEEKDIILQNKSWR